MERWAYEYFRRQAIEDRCKQEESRGSDELMGYSVTTADNKEYYSPDVKAIQALLMPVVVMEPERDIVEELKKLDMMRDVMARC